MGNLGYVRVQEGGEEVSQQVKFGHNHVTQLAFAQAISKRVDARYGQLCVGGGGEVKSIKHR